MHGLKENNLSIASLTRKNSKGVLYVRSEDVVTQIKETISLDNVALIMRAKISDYETAEFLQEECLVFLIRRAWGNNDDNLVNSLFEILFGRCAPFIYRHLGFNEEEKRDNAYKEVVNKLFEKIIDLESNRSDFLQVKFWVVVKNLTITAFTKYLPGPIEKNSVALDVEKIERADYMANDQPLENLLIEENFAEAKRVLLSLSERHLEVFILSHEDGWPIESNDPDKITLSNHFSVTSRTIRNWLAEGMTALKNNLGEEGK